MIKEVARKIILKSSDTGREYEVVLKDKEYYVQLDPETKAYISNFDEAFYHIRSFEKNLGKKDPWENSFKK